MGNKIRELLRKYCKKCTIVGPQYFYLYRDMVSRCFWLVNLLVAISMSGFITWLLYSRFLSMPTRITIESQYEPMSNMPYPAITLCSPSQITTSSMTYFKKNLVHGELNISLEHTLPQLRGFYQVIHDLNIVELKHLQYLLELNRYTISETLSKIPQSCERFLKRCVFVAKVYDCAELFQPVITTRGYCCAFNSKYYFDGHRITHNPHFKNHMVNAPGFQFSLTVVTDYEPELVPKNDLNNAGATQVMVTDTSEFPERENILVQPNGEAMLTLEVKFTYCSEDTRLLPSWSRGCNFENEQRLPFFRDYHNSDCYLSCYLTAILRACHCVVLMETHSHVQCSLTNIPCIASVKQNLSSWITPDKCDCPRDCESRKYSVDLIMGNFNAIPYLIEPMNPFKGLTFNESTTIFNFFFPSAVYVVQKQETVMSIVILLSNLGGVFGLFLGCSVISVLEMFFYVYQGIKTFIRELKKRRRNMTEKMTQKYINKHQLINHKSASQIRRMKGSIEIG